jgi:hypothetical protein
MNPRITAPIARRTWRQYSLGELLAGITIVGACLGFFGAYEFGISAAILSSIVLLTYFACWRPMRWSRTGIEDRWFLRLSSVAIVVGTALGYWSGRSEDYATYVAFACWVCGLVVAWFAAMMMLVWLDDWNESLRPDKTDLWIRLTTVVAMVLAFFPFAAAHSRSERDTIVQAGPVEIANECLAMLRMFPRPDEYPIDQLQGYPAIERLHPEHIDLSATDVVIRRDGMRVIFERTPDGWELYHAGLSRTLLVRKGSAPPKGDGTVPPLYPNTE